MEIDLCMQETLAAGPKSIQQIDFTWKLEQDSNTTMPFIIEEVKKNFLDFSRKTVRRFARVNLFCFNIISIKSYSI